MPRLSVPRLSVPRLSMQSIGCGEADEVDGLDVIRGVWIVDLREIPRCATVTRATSRSERRR